MTCVATLEIGDDYGDNEATMHCQLEIGHSGRHREEFFDGRAIVEWNDEPAGDLPKGDKS